MRDKFQVNLEPEKLYHANTRHVDVIKVGILPFTVASDPAQWRFLLMRPVAEAKHLGKPAYQLAKGTRHIHINDNWCDMREDDLKHADESFWEPLVTTALREGHEEVGLKPPNIKRLFDLGVFTFTSTSKGLKKPLHMFAAQVRSTDDFDSYEKSTAETKWMSVAEFAACGRADHTDILKKIMDQLQPAFSAAKK